MRSLITLIVIAAFAAAPLVRAADPTPSPSPAASASPAKKHSKKSKAAAAATPAAASNPAATPAATPAAKKQKAPEPQAAQAPGGGNGQVWVNTESHVYHKEGSKWYGKTKNGKYMSEADAVKEGDKAAKNEKQ
jgi:predicted lipid-binding transport protein (Tim44 family)